MSQATTLNALFHSLPGWALNHLKEGGNAAYFETCMRLAFKAQSQCRATLETLANIKNPPTVFARQANIAHGPQQINNGVPSAGSRAEKPENPQNEQSGASNELLPDGRASQAASRVDTQVEGLGEVDRSQFGSG